MGSQVKGARRRRGRRDSGRILGNLAELGRRILECGLLPIALGLEQLEVLPQDVTHKDGGTGAEVVLPQAAHLPAAHLE